MIYLLTALLINQTSGLPTRATDTNPFVKQTVSTLTLYVDPIGDNNNPCTASGAQACATLNGALSKVPLFARNTTTINIAAGTYSETISVEAFNGAALNITGPSLTNFSPATGSATGSLTTVVNTIPPVMTDSGQTWTVNNLRGRFFCMTSGGQNGQCRAITDNTATTVTLASPFASAPSTTNTYAVQTPSAIFTGSGSTFAISLGYLRNFTSTVSNIDFVTTGAATACTVRSIYTTVTFSNVRCIATTSASATALTLAGGSSTTGISIFMGGNVGGSVSLSQPAAGAERFNPVNSFFFGNAGYGLFINGQVNILSGTFTAQTNSSSSTVVAALGINNTVGTTPTTGASTGPILRCNSSPASGLVDVLFTSGGSRTELYFGNIYIDGCSIGVNLAQSSGSTGTSRIGVLNAGSFTCNNVTTCVTVNIGSVFRYPSTVTHTGVTTEIILDGVDYTFANLTGSVPTAIVNPVYGTMVFQN